MYLNNYGREEISKEHLQKQQLRKKCTFLYHKVVIDFLLKRNFEIIK